MEDGKNGVGWEFICWVSKDLRRLWGEAVTNVARIRAACRIAHVERNWGSVGRKPRLEADRGLRPVTTLTNFLLAGPDQFHRLADRLGDFERLGNFVRTQPPAEATPGGRVVDCGVL